MITFNVEQIINLILKDKETNNAIIVVPKNMKSDTWKKFQEHISKEQYIDFCRSEYCLFDYSEDLLNLLITYKYDNRKDYSVYVIKEKELYDCF